MFENIKSIYFLKLIFQNLKQKRILELVKYNKNIQNKLLNNKTNKRIKLNLTHQSLILKKIIKIKYYLIYIYNPNDRRIRRNRL